MIFLNRREAGRVLAARLAGYTDPSDVVVLALPRGGVPVGYEVARALHVPLDVFLVRKLGVPGHEELAMGAVATGGVRVLQNETVRVLRIDDAAIEAATRREVLELDRRERAYRGVEPPLPVTGRTALLVDDGLATGSTMRAATKALRLRNPHRIVIAVPVGAVDTCSEMAEVADEVICAVTPDPFVAVGLWYRDFNQTTDAEVRELLERSRWEYAAMAPTSGLHHAPTIP